MAGLRPISRMLALILGVSTILAAPWVTADTLQGAIHETLVSNPDILSAKAKENAAFEDILQARGAYFPSVEIASGIGKQYSNNPFTRSTNQPNVFLVHKEAQIFLSQLLFDGGNVTNTVAQRKFDWQTSEYQLAEVRENLAFLTATAYLDILRNRELVEVGYRAVASHQQTLNDVNRLLIGGAGLKSDLELAQGRLARSKADLDFAKQALANSEVTYTKLVGTFIPEVLEQPTPPTNIPNSMQQAQEVASQFNPAVQAALAQMNASTAAVGVAKSVFYPRFSLDLNSTYNNNINGLIGDDHESQAMLRMSYNLFHGGSDVAAVKSAIDKQAAAQYTIASVQRQVDEQVGFAWNQLEANKAAIPQLKKYTGDSLDVFHAYQKQYKLGQRTLFDLLDAETEHYDALRLYINSRYDEKTAKYQLLATMGNLVSTMAYSHLDARSEFAPKELVVSEPLVQSAPPEFIPDNKHLLKTLPPPEMVVPSEDAPLPPVSIPEPVEATPSSVIPSETLIEPAPADPLQEVSPSDTVIPESTSTPVISKHLTQTTSTSPKQPVVVNKGDRYTIQLLASKDKTALDSFIVSNNLQEQVKYFHTVVDGQEWYRLVYGDYDSPQTAWGAIDTIPQSLQNFEPLVRTFASIRGEEEQS